MKDELDQKTALIETLEMQSASACARMEGSLTESFAPGATRQAVGQRAIRRDVPHVYRTAAATSRNIVPGGRRQDVFDILRATGAMCGGTAPTRGAIDTGASVCTPAGGVPQPRTPERDARRRATAQLNLRC